MPTIAPIKVYDTRAAIPEVCSCCIGNIGQGAAVSLRSAAAVALATATGIRERGRNSNSSNSTASNTPDTGLPKVADMPAAAPAARRIFSLVSSRRKKLADERANRSSGDDDWALGAKGTPSTDGDGCGNWLENSDSRGRFDSRLRAPLHHLRNSMSAYCLRAIPRHQTDHHAADNRNDQHQQAELVGRWRDKAR